MRGLRGINGPCQQCKTFDKYLIKFCIASGVRQLHFSLNSLGQVRITELRVQRVVKRRYEAICGHWSEPSCNLEALIYHIIIIPAFFDWAYAGTRVQQAVGCSELRNRCHRA